MERLLEDMTYHYQEISWLYVRHHANNPDININPHLKELTAIINAVNSVREYLDKEVLILDEVIKEALEDKELNILLKMF